MRRMMRWNVITQSYQKLSLQHTVFECHVSVSGEANDAPPPTTNRRVSQKSEPPFCVLTSFAEKKNAAFPICSVGSSHKKRRDENVKALANFDSLSSLYIHSSIHSSTTVHVVDHGRFERRSNTRHGHCRSASGVSAWYRWP